MPAKKRKTAKEGVKSMFINMNSVLEQVGKDKGIPKEVLVEAIESAMLSAARRRYSPEVELEAHYNEELGEVELFMFRQVVEEVEDPDTEISISDANKLDPETVLGDSLGEKIDSNQFGRIAAQAAKQVIIQKVRDAERDIIYNEYKDRVGEIVTGIIRRIEKGSMIIDLGRTEAVLTGKEQVPTENYKVNDRVQACLIDLRKDNKGPQIVLSRRHPALIKALFSMEVPEISEGIVEIKAVAREPGSRAKIAVYSSDSDVDPVGACVGMKGSRVQSVVQELRGEKIDIVNYVEEPAQFVCNAIKPAEVNKVIVHDKNLSMEIIVPDDQLSLAIGKRGQNVRLAAQLTGWNIDIYSESKIEEIQKRAKKSMAEELQIDESLASILYSHGFRSTREISELPLEEMLKLPGIGQELLTQIHERAKQRPDKQPFASSIPSPAEPTEEVQSAGEEVSFAAGSKEEDVKTDLS